MDSQPLTMLLVECGGNDNEPVTIIISDTEIRLHHIDERYRRVLFKVDTAFRVDELAQGAAYSQTMPSRTMQPLTLNDLSGLRIAASLYPGSGGKATECEKYIAEVKYRREKNDRIEYLDKENKRLQSGKVSLQEALDRDKWLQSVDKIRRLTKENERLKSDNRELLKDMTIARQDVSNPLGKRELVIQTNYELLGSFDLSFKNLGFCQKNSNYTDVKKAQYRIINENLFYFQTMK
jgi:hypothetical protein